MAFNNCTSRWDLRYSTVQSGGYDHRFTKQIPDKYICMICHNVQREATITSCCSKHYCMSCLQSWIGRVQISCPNCRNASFKYFVNRQQVQEINEMEIYCSNEEEGCTWKGKLEDLKTHLDSNCDYATVSCPNNCRKYMLRKELHRHKNFHCLLRSHQCEFCGKKGTYHSLTGICDDGKVCGFHEDHYKVCDEYPLNCPNECKEKLIKRKNMKRHREECQLEPVSCPFKEVGCERAIPRKDLKAHIDTSDHNHLMLMMKAFKEKVLKPESNMTTSAMSSTQDYYGFYEEPPRKRMRCYFD